LPVDLAPGRAGIGPRVIEPLAGLRYLRAVSIFVVIKRPGEPANVIEAPEPLGMTYIQTKVGGFIQVFPSRGHVSETLQGVTLVIDEDGRRKDLPANVEFPLDVVVGPILACVTDEEGYEHGMPLEQAEAVARALDHYAVGKSKLVN